jgi:hypothetical protein
MASFSSRISALVSRLTCLLFAAKGDGYKSLNLPDEKPERARVVCPEFFIIHSF